jgi:retron-type reverse transcriptase
MKSHSGLFETIVSFKNLLNAAHKAQKGKRTNEDTARFNVNLEKELWTLHRQLEDRTYRPGSYQAFYIHEPKRRMISAAPYRDRVVHHALCNVIEPLFEKTFIFDSYANRKGKGTHKAVLRYQAFSRGDRYVLKCDIRKYFPSIDHQILKNEIRTKIEDPGALWLIEMIIDNSNAQEEPLNYFPGDSLLTPVERRKGLPIGNLTSQFFANVYLNRFDHFIKENLRCKHYVRYVDDFAVFHGDKAFLRHVKSEASRYLEEWRLALHPEKSKVHPVDTGLEFLGHRVFPRHKLLKKRNVVLFRRKLKRLQTAYAKENVDWEYVKCRIQAWNAHAAFSDTYRLRKKLFDEFTFSRDPA